jgi:hypothetical protein
MPKRAWNSRGNERSHGNKKVLLNQILGVAVLAVCSELLSTCKFPDPRENTGNFIDFGTMARAWPQQSQSIGGEIPYSAKQGI